MSTETLCVREMLQTIEQVRCPNCDAAIARECSASNIDMQTGERTLKCYCEHCQRLYVASYRLRGGIWELSGQVELVTDERRLRGFRARIAQMRGDVLVKAEVKSQKSEE